jgi:alpha-galactosidase
VFGQLGLGAVKKQSKPKLVEEIAHEKVQLLCCGSFETVRFIMNRNSECFGSLFTNDLF